MSCFDVKMRFLTEKCFYVCIVSILAFLALLLPLAIIGAEHKPPPRYVFIGFSKNFTDWSKYDHIIWGMPPELRPFAHLFRPHDDRVNPRQLNFDDSWYSIERLGTTSGNESVHVVKLQKPSMHDKPIVLLAGGLQKGDKNAILATLRLMKNTKSSKILDVFDLHFIPVLDPEADAPPMGATNTSENGWRIFKQYFNQYKKLFKAVFLLLTPQMRSRQEKRMTLPHTFMEKAPQRYNLFKNAVKSSEIGNLFGVFSSNNSGGIDEWLVRQTLPTPVLVVNVEIDFRPNLAINNALFLESVTKHLYTLLELLHVNKNLTNS